MPPHDVKPYVKRGKNDAADAEAICEAVTRPSMRFVPVKGTDIPRSGRCDTVLCHRPQLAYPDKG